MKTFESFELKNLSLKNRVVFPPMDLYCADEQGNVNDEHYVHYVSRAVGGAGFIIMEATAITPNGRISDQCLGIWEDRQIEGMSRIVKQVKKYGAAIALQLNHAGRKCTANQADDNYTLAPSSIAYDETYRTPGEITKEEIKEVVSLFARAADRANQAGFDAIEIHGAHGYLISEFLSPLTNKRTDEYGGSTENRARFLQEVIDAVSAVWPSDKALLLRLSASDHLPEGMQPEEMVKIVNMVKDRIDLFHISSGGVALAPIDLYPGYQVKFAETIKYECDVPVIAVGLIKTLETTEEILGNKRADLVAIGREMFRNPYWVIQHTFEKGEEYDYPGLISLAFVDKLR